MPISEISAVCRADRCGTLMDPIAEVKKPLLILTVGGFLNVEALVNVCLSIALNNVTDPSSENFLGRSPVAWKIC